MPFSISTVFCVGDPSSSTLSEPRREGSVPLSTTVHLSGHALAHHAAEGRGPLRLKSASSPWPIASCSRMPGQPGPSTTSISPAGASRASSWMMAWRAASWAKCSGVFSVRKKSMPTRPPPPEAAFGGAFGRLGNADHAEARHAAGRRWQKFRRSRSPGSGAARQSNRRAPAQCADRKRAPRGRHASPGQALAEISASAEGEAIG